MALKPHYWHFTGTKVNPTDIGQRTVNPLAYAFNGSNPFLPSSFCEAETFCIQWI